MLLVARKSDGWGWHGLKGMLAGLCRLGGFTLVLLSSLAVLHPLEHDSHPTIRSLATSTILMLRYSRQQAKSGGGRLVELRCWPCNPLFRHKYD